MKTLTFGWLEPCVNCVNLPQVRICLYLPSQHCALVGALLQNVRSGAAQTKQVWDLCLMLSLTWFSRPASPGQINICDCANAWSEMAVIITSVPSEFPSMLLPPLRRVCAACSSNTPDLLPQSGMYTISIRVFTSLIRKGQKTNKSINNKSEI